MPFRKVKMLVPYRDKPAGEEMVHPESKAAYLVEVKNAEYIDDVLYGENGKKYRKPRKKKKEMKPRKKRGYKTK